MEGREPGVAHQKQGVCWGGGSEIISDISEIVSSTLSAGRDYCPRLSWVSAPQI